MKVLLINAELGYRGTPRTLANYARMLRDHCEVAIWGYHEGGETAKLLLGEGFEVFVGDKDRVRAFAYAPDIVNLHRPGMRIDEEKDILKQFKQNGAKCIETSVFGRVDYTAEPYLDLSLQISRWDLFRWNAWKGRYGVPGILLPNPVDTASFNRTSEEAIRTVRREWNIPDDGLKPFVLGRIGKTYWPFLERPLLDALKRHQGLYFVSVDDYGGKALPSEIACHPRVRIQKCMKNADELTRFYSACDACVNMSGNGESFGFVNAESMCCATPVIALSTPLHDNAQVEMVQNDIGGIVLGKPLMLPDVINDLSEKPSYRQSLASKCRELIVSRYSIEHLRSVLLNIFTEVHKCATRKELRERLSALQFIMEIPTAEMFQQLSSVKGGCAMATKIATRCFYSSYGYKVLCLMKRAKAALRSK